MGNSQGKPVVFTDQVNLNHFRLLRVVGKGAFGKVRIVERKDNGSTYALKYIRKDEVVRSESVRNIIRERRMLEHLNHPFLCNLRYSFQDVEYLYLVVDLMTGGDLRFHIARKTFTEEAVRFWIAELGCALRYIHGMGIVHRDVKPDNVLLDAEGHVHLADFNVASEIKPGKELTSKSGTLAYLAPEVYEGRGYGTEVDWWSLGVLFYECIYNKRPFEASNHDLLGQKIVRGHVNYPTTNPVVSNVCLHAISSLLEKDRRARIGAISWESFWDNPFFRPLDFNALERKEIEPIFIPSTDKTNFDATYDLEELLLEEAPLEARARRQKPRSELKQTATEKEIREDELHRMIETLFEPFDFTLVQFDKERAASTAVPMTHGSGGKDTPTSQHTNSQGESPGRQQQYHTPHGFSGPLVKIGSREEEVQAARASSSSPVFILEPRAEPRVTPGRNRERNQSPNGSPPLPPASNLSFDLPREHRDRLLAMDRDRDRGGVPRSMPEHFDGMENDDIGLPIQRIIGQPRPKMEAQRAERKSARRAPPRTPSRGNEPTVSGSQLHQQQQYSQGHSQSQQQQQQQQYRGQYEVRAIGSDAWPELMDMRDVAAAGPLPAPGLSTMATGMESTSADELAKGGKPSGMLGFLSRKKGRDRSPKAKERGVIGKEGARHIVSDKDR